MNALEFYVGPLRSLKVLTTSGKKWTSYYFLCSDFKDLQPMFKTESMEITLFAHEKTLKVLKVVALTSEALKVTRESPVLESSH